MRNKFARIYCRLRAIVGATAVISLLMGAASAFADPSPLFNIVSLSSQADAVSGETVLLRVNLPPNLAAGNVMVTLNSEDVTSAFHPEAGGNSLLGLLTGLSVGQNTVIAQGFNKQGKTHLSAALML